MATNLIEKVQVVDHNIEEDKSKEEIYEIKNYLECRYQTAWRIFVFDIHVQKPAVTRLPLDLPDQQTIIYNEETNLENIISKDGIERTMLTEFFEMCKRCPEAIKLTYSQFLTKYVWNSDIKTWIKDKKDSA